MCMDETMDLIRRAHAGDEEAREQLVMGNVGLVWSVARHYSGRGHELEDLFQIGCIGLLKAVDKFDLGFQVRFPPMQVPMIAGKPALSAVDGMIRVSRSMKELDFASAGAGNPDGKVRAGTGTFGDCEGTGYQL